MTKNGLSRVYLAVYEHKSDLTPCIGSVYAPHSGPARNREYNNINTKHIVRVWRFALDRVENKKKKKKIEPILFYNRGNRVTVCFEIYTVL